MKIVITESQYKKVIFTLLDTLYGPNLLIETIFDRYGIYSSDGVELFTIYTGKDRSKGCKVDMLVYSVVLDDIESFISKAITRKKLFSKTIISYVYEKTNLNVDCVEFHQDLKNDSKDITRTYNFDIKKNKGVSKINY